MSCPMLLMWNFLEMLKLVDCFILVLHIRVIIYEIFDTVDDIGYH